MSESFENKNKTDENEGARLKDNLKKFEQFRTVCDVRQESGQSWYKREFTDRVDYRSIFNYLSTHFSEGNTPFTNALFHIVRAQLLFQKKLVTLEGRINARSGTLDIPEESFSSLESSYRALKSLQDRYHVKKRTGRQGMGGAYDQFDEENARRNEKDDALKAFIETLSQARRTGETPWPTDPDLLNKKKPSKVKLQPEDIAPSSKDRKSAAEEPAPVEPLNPEGQEAHDELKENYKAFSALREQFDIRTNGYLWYVGHFGESIDFSKVFRYLQFHEINGAAQSDGALLPLMKAQIALQDLIDSVQKKQIDAATEDEVFEADLQSLNGLTRTIVECQKQFEASGNGEASRNNFLSIQYEARDFVEPEPEAAFAAQESAQGGTGADAPDISPEFSSRSSFEFHPELLRTGEGRTKVFRAMVHMYNSVRNKRDELGFEGRKNIKNIDFDGYLSFRRMYLMLRKRIAEFSERGAVKDAEGKTLSHPDVTEITEEESAEFNTDFAFLAAYYARTETFEASKPAAPVSEPAPTPEPEAGTSSGSASSSAEAQTQEETSSTASGPEPVSTPKAETPYTPPPQGTSGPEKQKEYEERLAIRNQWREKKSLYETQYEAYLKEARERKDAQSVFQKMAFWRKENIPGSVLQSQREYEEARRTYAASLATALLGRVGAVAQAPGQPSPEEKIEGLRAGLANRFVLKAAHDRLALEKQQFVPEGRALQVFADLQKTLKKHRTLIRAAGYATVAGVALLSGGIGAAVIALGSKTLQTKVSAVLTAAGATGGAYLGNRISETVIEVREKRRNSALKNAQQSFSIERLDTLEQSYLERYRSHESAVRNKKYVIGAGALAGGILGAIAAQNFHDVTNAIPTPTGPAQIPPVIAPAPEIVPAPEAIPVPDASAEPLLSHEELEHQLDLPPDGGASSAAVEAAPATPIEQLGVEHPDISSTTHVHIEHPSENDLQTPPLEAIHMPYTFEHGSRVDTVSEALYESWKQDPGVIGDSLTKKEFLAHMYSALSQIEKDPSLNSDLLDRMGVTSGDFDKVQVGQTIDLEPFFEYLNTKH